jgi:hypothetical protein
MQYLTEPDSLKAQEVVAGLTIKSTLTGFRSRRFRNGEDFNGFSVSHCEVAEDYQRTAALHCIGAAPKHFKAIVAGSDLTELASTVCVRLMSHPAALPGFEFT